MEKKREEEWKERWEISHPISHAPQLPFSFHSPHWLLIAGANLLGEKRHAGKKWNHLNSLTHTYPTAPSFSSFPSTHLFSSLQSLRTSKAWKRNTETLSVALCFSIPHFVLHPHSPLLSIPGFCLLPTVILRGGWEDKKINHHSSSKTSL